MLRSQNPSRSIFVVCALVSGCAHDALSRSATVDGRRVPDGVAIDPLAALPDTMETAEASSGVVALSTPLGSDAARSTIRSFFEAIGREDLESLREVLSADAAIIHPTTRVRDRVEFVFMRRFQRLEYFALASGTFWQDGALEVYRSSEARGLWADSVGAQPTPLVSMTSDALVAGDVVVRVGINVPRGAGVALLGDTMTFLLRRAGGRYVIHRLVEEFVVP